MFTQTRRLYPYLSLLAGVVFVLLPGCSPKVAVLADLPKPVFGASAAKQVANSSVQARKASQWLSPALNNRTRLDGTVPSNWYPPVPDRQWNAIVVHHSASPTGGAAAFDKQHRQVNGWDELGYHFVIGNGTDTRDGLVEIGPRWLKQKHGAHCKTPGNFYNEHGIGICLVGDFEQQYPSAEQIEMLKKLITFLMNRYNIPPEHVYGHGELKSTQCPGRHMSTNNLRSWLQRQEQIYASSR
jgi:N-acetyl-anhydromuramyl-L-alanine amidase AmpD